MPAYGVWWAKADRAVAGEPRFATYSTWDLAFPHTVGVRGVKYKKFESREAAWAGMGVPSDAERPPHDPSPRADPPKAPDGKRARGAGGGSAPRKRARGAVAGPRSITVFTDGGVWGQGTSLAAAGWGVAVFAGKDLRGEGAPMASLSGALPFTGVPPTSPLAEMVALRIACEYLATHEDTLPRDVVVRIDCDCVRKVDAHPFRHAELRSEHPFTRERAAVQVLLAGLRARGWDLALQRVPGHKGVPGNELADRLATQGLELARRVEAVTRGAAALAAAGAKRTL